MKNKISIMLFIASFYMLFTGCKKVSYEYPFQNPSLSPAERAADIVSRLTLEEKVSQMLNGTPAIERFGILPYDWWNECLHGAGVSCDDYAVTVYPQAIAMAAGWDTEAVKTMAEYTSDEVRAIYNTAQAKQDYRIFRGLTCWSPNINIFRDPRWGRGQETYGEDPFLTACIGKNFVTGLQGNDPKYLKVAACAKHYAVHSGPEPKRHIFNVSVSNYDLWDTYLPAFKELVVDAKVAGVMCAYNAYEGQPCCGSDKLLVDILRNEWDFTGYVTSDCGAINDFYNNHKTHPDAPSAAADAVIHGTDVDCGYEAYNGLIQAVKDGKITEAQIDVSLRRLFEIRFRLGMFDPKEQMPFSKIDFTSFSNPAHKAMALKMAQQSIVLLKNDGTLPFKKEGLKKIALVGPNVDRPEVQLGNYNGYPKKSYTPLDGFKEKLPDAEIVYIQGCDYTTTDYIVNLGLENYISSPDGKGEGFKVAFFNNPELKGEPVYTGYSKLLNFERKNDEPVAPGVALYEHSGRFEGIFESPLTGEIEMKIDFDDGYRFYIDGKVVCEDFNRHTLDSYTYVLKAEKGKKYAFKMEYVQHERGSKIILEAYRRHLENSQDDIDKIKDADLIVFVGGISPRIEGEEMNIDLPGFYRGDRTSILLPQAQTNLLKTLKETGKPVVLAIMSGCTIALPKEIENTNAILNIWYGGEFAGNALADVIFGDYNPSGHLPLTAYASDSDLPDFEDYNMANRTYKYFQGKPQYPFGFGLSYTAFAYEWASLPKKEYKPDGTIQCAVTVKNTGDKDGDAVSQVYIKYPGGKGFPLKELRSFERKNIPQGKNYRMNVSIPINQLAKWDEAAGKLVVPAGTYSIYAGSHSEDEAVIASFEIK
ncbi:MAG: glycoside hydrolase family 3 C-terminal domain-containing protein [Dysgonamonadaceae bacterium]|jgi:beta-glucosidase|nr:glycoside hydrolase family 3 C-terminal domain-containing protein [Dysgonamonadaceae bacterium]